MPRKPWKTLFILFLVLLITGSRAQEEDEGEEPPKTCTQYVFGLVRAFVGSLGKCLGGQVPLFRLNGIHELFTRFFCLVKCILADLGVLNSEGVLDEVAALLYFQEAIPEEILESVIEQAQPCLEMASGFNPKEYYCQSYSGFTQCVVTSLLGTFSPYALGCFTNPALGALFSFLQFVVPRASPAAAQLNNLRRRANSARRTIKNYNNQSISSVRSPKKKVLPSGPSL